MVRGCFAALIDGSMNSALCQKILKCPAICLCLYVQVPSGYAAGLIQNATASPTQIIFI